MHKVRNKTYNLTGNVTYFVGPNGVGKSTILEAIQLALLGYIPGYSKTAEGIMKHSCGSVMAVELKTDSGITIKRTWTRSGTSVKTDTQVGGYVGDIADLVGNIELPVFNFNEFRSMTANKLKEWFIAFLPNEDGCVDLTDELKKDAQSRALPFEGALNSAAEWLSTREEKGVELVKAFNAYLKDEQSYTKGKVAELQGTINSLIHYDDADMIDETEIENNIRLQRDLENQVVAYESKQRMYNEYLTAISVAESRLPYKSADEDTRISELLQAASSKRKEAGILREDAADIQQAINELTMKKHSLGSSGSSSNCPFTGSRCETAAALVSKRQSEIAEIDKQIQFKREESLDCNPLKIDALEREARDYELQASTIRSEYQRLETMRSSLIDPGPRPTTLTIEDIRSEMNRWQDALVKVKANKRYDELTQTVTKDKFENENYLEILKSWIKLTDANGLQSSMMDKPFQNMESEMTGYLTSMFNRPTQAMFNLISKANSFSFGLVRDGGYIEFDYLSSGERCLFTLAMIMCILNKSDASLPVIIIDDILDHLDEDNADYLFSAIKNVDSIQFILAGVKECKDSTICAAV